MSDPEADFWMWDYFFPYDGEPSVSKSFTVAAPAATGTSSSHLIVNLQGSFIGEISPNHVAEVRLNNILLGGSQTWNGHDAHRLALDIPEALLADGDNTIKITALLIDGLDFDEYYLDSFELQYDRSYRALDDRLVASSHGQPEVFVSGFSSSDISVFDLSDPLHPVGLDPVRIYSDGGSYTVGFSTAGSPSHLWPPHRLRRSNLNWLSPEQPRV